MQAGLEVGALASAPLLSALLPCTLPAEPSFCTFKMRQLGENLVWMLDHALQEQLHACGKVSLRAWPHSQPGTQEPLHTLTGVPAATSGMGEGLF